MTTRNFKPGDRVRLINPDLDMPRGMNRGSLGTVKTDQKGQFIGDVEMDNGVQIPAGAFLANRFELVKEQSKPIDVDNIMRLAYHLADAKAAHALAVDDFSNDLADYGPIPDLAAQWVAAESALRAALTGVQS